MLDGILKIIYIICFIAGSVIRAIYTKGNRKSRIASNHETALDKLLLTLSSLGLIIIPLFYLLSPWLDFADYILPAWAALMIGLPGALIFIFALWMLWRSHADLGKNWLPVLKIREEHTLITHGIYAYIRHPMYAAHWLWGIAQALLLQNWIAGLSMLASFIPIYLFRSSREEQMMIQRFGEEYRSYITRTGRILPRRAAHQTSQRIN